MSFLRILSFLFIFAIAVQHSHGGSPLGVTHMLPSPKTLPAGVFVYGTSLAFGVTDRFQVGTNLHALLSDIPNLNSQLSLYHSDDWALALTVGASQYDVEDVYGNKLATIDTYTSGLVLGVALSDKVAWTNGVEYAWRYVEGSDANIVISGLFGGTKLQSELGWIYNDGRALDLGVSYDTTFSLWGFGLGHHWDGFHLAIHYYPDADQDKVLPIISGSGAISF